MHITRDFEIKQAVLMYGPNGYNGVPLWRDKTPEKEIKELVSKITIPLQNEDTVRSIKLEEIEK